MVFRFNMHVNFKPLSQGHMGSNLSISQAFSFDIKSPLSLYLFHPGLGRTIQNEQGGWLLEGSMEALGNSGGPNGLRIF